MDAAGSTMGRPLVLLPYVSMPRFCLLPLLLLLTTPAWAQGRFVDTRDKPTAAQLLQTWVFDDGALGFHNRFEGARLSHVQQHTDSTYELLIQAENVPINNSPWYAFKVWADAPRTVHLTLRYDGGTHRYRPKLSHDGATWTPLDDTAYRPDTTRGTADFTVPVGPDTLWVSAQELLTGTHYATWMDDYAAHPFVSRRPIGTSAQGVPLTMLEITEAGPEAGVVLLIGRQHPPEVTGAIAMLTFMETLAADTPLARAFRHRYLVAAVPFMNPDGVNTGQWRHNAHGIDLNRDWVLFNQPETRAVRNAFLDYEAEPARPLLFGLDFHSTWQDVFYPLDPSIPTTPPGLYEAWRTELDRRLPGYPIPDQPGRLNNPVSRNWFYNAFQIPSVIYEVGDTTDRDEIRQVATQAAEALMTVLNALGGE